MHFTNMESSLTAAHQPPSTHCLSHTPNDPSIPHAPISGWKRVCADVLASVAGSAACVYTGQPFDTIKVRLQLSPLTQSTSLLSIMRSAVTENGIQALWRGSSPAFLGALLENGVAFTTNGMLQRLLKDKDWMNDSSSLGRYFFSGAVTGAATALVLCPCDVAKCRAQASIVQNGSYSGMSVIVTSILRSKGVAGLFQGMTAQFVRDVPFYTAFFGSYQIISEALQKHTDLPDTSVYFLAGGFAGQIGWLTSIVPDTIKSRIQTSDAPSGIIRTAKDIFRAYGWRGFFAGIEVALIRAFPANAALFVGYELTREVLEDVL
jgi:hypothetical protein